MYKTRLQLNTIDLVIGAHATMNVSVRRKIQMFTACVHIYLYTAYQHIHICTCQYSNKLYMEQRKAHL